MDKMKMQSPDMTENNIDKIAKLFPNCITESRDEKGNLKKAVNFDILKQMLSKDIAEGDECYEFTWVGKKEAIVKANKPICKTLRPCKEESVNWDTTENLYIEGDNLEVLKLLQESYFGKVKMIYIDPPYNTGSDKFIYTDDFHISKEEYEEMAHQRDENGLYLFKENSNANPQFHSVWCSMIYSRLMLARNLLSDDGVIFISIDEHEIENLTKISDEVFGASNHVSSIIIKSNPRGSMSTAEVASLHEYLVIYTKKRDVARIIGHELTESMTSEYKYNDEKGAYRLLGLRMRGGFWRRTERPNLYFPIYINPNTLEISLEQSDEFHESAVPVQPSTMEDGTWRWSKEKVSSEKSLLIPKKVKRNDEEVWDIFQKDYLNSDTPRRTKAKSIWDEKEINYQSGTTEIKNLFGNSGVFDYSKPIFLIQQALKMIDISNEDIILDFFSGSATTAHAVMQLNAEDGGNRKFIMVQLPEKTDEKSEAYKAGYKNICEIGKERIRRAGAKIKKETQIVSGFEQLGLNSAHYADDVMDAGKETADSLDIGFRVLKLDETNMTDVYYSPLEINQQMLLEQVENIKPDRTDLDLLFGCLIDWGVPLNMPYVSEDIEGYTVHTYNDGDLIACFDKNVSESVVKEIAKRQPLRAVFRDSSFADSPSKINVGEIFKMIAPDTRVRVI